MVNVCSILRWAIIMSWLLFQAEQITAEFRERARRYHPDKFSNAEEKTAGIYIKAKCLEVR